MTNLTRFLAYGLGFVLVAGLVILAVAGVSAARALAATAGAMVLLVALGGLLGGRRNSAGSSSPATGEQPDPAPESVPDTAEGGTMEG